MASIDKSAGAKRPSRLVILGAGRPHRGEDPSALVFTSGSRRVLDWVIDAAQELNSPEIHFIGGYKVEEVIRHYPHLHFSVNPEWQKSGPVASLLAAPLDPQSELFLSYADIVYSRKAMRALQDASGDVVLVVDRQWKERYSKRTGEDLAAAEKVHFGADGSAFLSKEIAVAGADGEFVGLMKLSPAAVGWIDSSLRRNPASAKHSVPDLVQSLAGAGFSVRATEIEGEWAELNEPEDLAQFALRTKAETLDRIRPHLRKSRVEEQVHFTVADWRAGKESIIQNIQSKLGTGDLIVRSSAVSEDGWAHSKAGEFLSVLSVPASDAGALNRAVSDVIDSYGDADGRHQVLVQRMIGNIAMSGVIFTRTLTGAPYYIINYDDTSSSTDSVTGGHGRDLKTLVVARSADAPMPQELHRFQGLLEAAKEVEELIQYDAIDLEFAVDKSNQVHLFQLRRITIDYSHRDHSDRQIAEAIGRAAQLFRGKKQPAPHVLGEKAIFGLMPDWNPAEIVGTKPRPLALSLYRHLITDEIWAQQRAEFGYRDLRPQPLLESFAGHPYVDVRASFNSFVPAGLPDQLAEKLVNAYLARLEANPTLHDKVEFDIAMTSYEFDFDERFSRRFPVFSAAERAGLKAALLEVTRRGIAGINLHYDQIAALSKRLGDAQKRGGSPIEKTSWLLGDCRRFGTLPFAHLARLAFVAVSFLRSLERMGILSPDEKTAFLASLRTVTSEFEKDGLLVQEGKLDFGAFVAKYGHLRPGTYDVTSLAYWENPETYLRHMVKERPVSAQERFHWQETTKRAIAAELSSSGLGLSFEEWEKFVVSAITGREYSKFIFTRNLSLAMAALVEYGESIGLSREEISFLRLSEILETAPERGMYDLQESLAKKAQFELHKYGMVQSVELPPLLTEEHDFYFFHKAVSEPNFVTRSAVTADLAKDSETIANKAALRGKIVLIPQADPGFDWLFGYGIAGLITMYGGANSHMTIRAAELKLPAAIGVGESMFETLQRAEAVELNCMERKIRVIR